jgi:hypothetical protein
MSRGKGIGYEKKSVDAESHYFQSDFVEECRCHVSCQRRFLMICFCFRRHFRVCVDQRSWNIGLLDCSRLDIGRSILEKNSSSKSGIRGWKIRSANEMSYLES